MIVSEASRFPEAAGVNNIAIVHWCPVATEPPQVLVWAKLLASLPDTASPVILKGDLPVLVRVMDAGLLDIATG